MTEKPDLLGMTLAETKAFVKDLGEAAFRGQQLYGWMQKGASFDEMTNLPLAFRKKLEAESTYRLPRILQKQVSKMDGTIKYLMGMIDGECVESVFMRYAHGNTVCVSCQAGCRMGCRFCASAIGGLERNLEVSEMLGQIYQIQRITGERVSNIVVMGTGEPLDNYGNFVKFIRMVSDSHGLHISQRNKSLD